MVSSRKEDEIVQVFKVMVIMGKKNSVLAKHSDEMDRIIFAGHTHIRGQQHIVARLSKQSSQQGGRTIIVQIQPHNRFSRAISSGVSSLGRPS